MNVSPNPAANKTQMTIQEAAQKLLDDRDAGLPLDEALLDYVCGNASFNFPMIDGKRELVVTHHEPEGDVSFIAHNAIEPNNCLLYTSPSPRD